MRLYKDTRSVDVQPKYVGDWESRGWSRTPPKRRKKKSASKSATDDERSSSAESPA